MKTKQAITNQVLQCTPKELQEVLNYVNELDGKIIIGAGSAQTIQDAINVLSQPRPMKWAEFIKRKTGKNYITYILDK